MAARQPAVSNVTQQQQQTLTDLLALLHADPALALPLLRVAQNMVATPFGDVTVKMQDGKPVLIETCKREKLT